MFRLIRMTGDRIGEELPLTLPATVGRHPRATVVIRDSRSSRYHTRIVPHGRGVRLEDLGSRNGTFLNRRRAQTAPLDHGDKIRIGETVLAFVDERGMEWVGRSVGEFQILSRTDRFTLASEFLARQPSMGREVSLVLLDDDIDPRQRDEAIAGARQSGKVRSPGALRVFDIVETEGRTLIVSEPPAGDLLETHLEEPGGPDARVLASMGIQLAEIAVAAQESGDFLRGLDPKRIYVGAGGTLKVSQVGLAGRLGRCPHLSPEEREGRPPTPASDVFAIGSLLARGGDALGDVVTRATAEDPGKRQSNPAVLAADLRKVQKRPARRQGPPPEEPPPPLGAGLRFLKGAAFLLLLGSLFILSSQVTRLILSR